MSKTYIVGGTREGAIDWCRQNGVQPFARDTQILTTERAMRGHTIRRDDVVIRLAPMGEALENGLRLAMMYGAAR